MFSGTLKDVTVDQDGGSAFVFSLKRNLQDAPKPREELALFFYKCREIAQSIANLQLESKAPNILVNNHRIINAIETCSSGLADNRSRLTMESSPT